jgi:hypothetical protein
MSETRHFANEALARMATPRVDRAIAAIKAGDQGNAEKEVRGMYREFSSMHNIYRDWVAAIFSFIYEKYGDKALYEVNHAAFSFWFKSLIQKYIKEEPHRRAQMLAAGFRGHLVPLKVEEDDKKFTVTMLPCGSGGNLVLEGGYEPPRNLARVKKAQPQTFSEENFPVYCTHCPFQEIISIEEVGYPVFVTDCVAGDKIGKEFCEVYIYKDPNDIPERFYERLGKKKPKAILNK